MSVCKFYAQGRCSKGKDCAFVHSPTHSLESAELKSAPGTVGAVQKGHTRLAPVSVTSLDSPWEGEEEEKLTKLKKMPKVKEEWVTAPVFVPRFLSSQSSAAAVSHPTQSDPMVDPWSPLSYSDVAKIGTDPEFVDEMTPEEAKLMLCPFAAKGDCPFGEECLYLHGMVCDLCGRQCLHPFDEEQRKSHHRECVAYHQREMEHSFAIQRSEGKQCAICMDVVLDKPKISERRFGILSACTHVFCLACIREWRGTSHQDKKTVRTCPLCRECSFFVIPSTTWVEDSEDKAALIEEYQSNLRKKPCTYFQQGEGTCPFGSSCFYLHAYPDGTPAVIKFRKAQTADGDVKAIHNVKLWDFVEARHHSSEGPPS